ncbi:arginine/serine-rich coiled-coil protein 2 [Biomphalaria pfeifferi]|uniref:Arginine/serine-rich coiled-coil protein 2 n=1 Tax=Biomphalaria pfeifferi TaxID=112525 RepID=A0AAD8C087_BIOPF|nr:arginine/serine-rich coiled-coil protein 2 [Biomphalaria pfeifferi]
MESEPVTQRNTERLHVTVDNVMEAIRSLKEAKGCTLAAVKKYIVANSSEPEESSSVTIQVKQALKRGVQNGQIMKIKSFKYVVSLDDEEGSKKRRRRRNDDDDLRRRRRRSRRRSRRRRRRRRRRSRRRRRRSRRRRRRSRRRRRRSRRRRRRSRRRRRC